MKIADRIQNLGTETAFLVSAEAADYRARGQRIYPFHLGDMNIITPANIIEATHQAMRDGKTGYCSNYGLAELRELLAADMNGPRGTGYTIDNVVIQPGGKPSIGKLLMALMNPGDEVLYPNPGVSDLRVPDRVPRWRGGPLRLRRGRAQLRDRPGADRSRDHAQDPDPDR